MSAHFFREMEMIGNSKNQESAKTEGSNKIGHQGIVLRHITFMGYENDIYTNYDVPDSEKFGRNRGEEFKDNITVDDEEKIPLKRIEMIEWFFYLLWLIVNLLLVASMPFVLT